MIPLRDENPSHTFPWVTVSIIVLCVVVFLLELNSTSAFFETFALFPSGVEHFGWWHEAPRFFTSVFLHGGWAHLIGNMWFLWIFGDNIEDFLGHFGFLVFYLATGWVAGAAHVLMNPGSDLPTVGASGAISGVLGAYIFLHPRIRVKTFVTLGFFWNVVNIPAVFFLGFWLLAQFVGMDPQVAYGAHLGGFFAGLGLIVLLSRKKQAVVSTRFESRRAARFHHH